MSLVFTSPDVSPIFSVRSALGAPLYSNATTLIPANELLPSLCGGDQWERLRTILQRTDLIADPVPPTPVLTLRDLRRCFPGYEVSGGSCAPCRPGTFSSAMDAPYCSKCSAFSFQPNMTAVDCVPCQNGTQVRLPPGLCFEEIEKKMRSRRSCTT